MTQEPTVSSERVYEGRILSLRLDTVELPGGKKTRREIVEHVECVAIVVLDSEENVLMVRQFRKPVERALLEIPAGGVEEGEEPLDCVRRELQEETGYLARRIERLGGFYSAPGYCTEFLHLYLATDLMPGNLDAEEDENIEVVVVPLSRVSQLIACGEICDAKSIAGLLTYLQTRKGN